MSSNENGVKPPLYSPSRTPFSQTVEAVITPSKSTNTLRAARSGGHAEMAAVDRNELIGLLVEAVPGQPDIGMRHGHARKSAVVEIALVRGVRRLRVCSASGG